MDEVIKAMDDRIKAAFDFAQESTKQFIALSSGIIALMITFQKDFIGGSVPAEAKLYLLGSWLLLLLSVFFGLWTLLALTGSLEPKGGNAQPSIYGKNIAIPAVLQILSFFVGLCLTVAFGFKSMGY